MHSRGVRMEMNCYEHPWRVRMKSVWNWKIASIDQNGIEWDDIRSISACLKEYIQSFNTYHKKNWGQRQTLLVQGSLGWIMNLTSTLDPVQVMFFALGSPPASMDAQVDPGHFGVPIMIEHFFLEPSCLVGSAPSQEFVPLKSYASFNMTNRCNIHNVKPTIYLYKI